MTDKLLDDLEKALEEISGTSDEPTILRAHRNLTPEQIAWINAGCPNPED